MLAPYLLNIILHLNFKQKLSEEKMSEKTEKNTKLEEEEKPKEVAEEDGKASKGVKMSLSS